MHNNSIEPTEINLDGFSEAGCPGGSAISFNNQQTRLRVNLYDEKLFFF